MSRDSRGPGNPKNIVGISSEYAYLGPYMPSLFLLYPCRSLFGSPIHSHDVGFYDKCLQASHIAPRNRQPPSEPRQHGRGVCMAGGTVNDRNPASPHICKYVLYYQMLHGFGM